MVENKVTPWEASDNVDYNKLIEEFGVKQITLEQRKYLEELAKKKSMEEHIFLKRGLYFAQMDLDKVIEAHKSGKPIFLYTGRAPGGSMHIGHLFPFMFTKFLQDIFDCNLYIQIPDDEKFLFKKDLTLDIVNKMVQQDLNEICAFGFDPDKTFIFKNSQYISNIYSLYLKIAKKLTFSQARNTFGFVESNNIGQIAYPAIQIAPTFFEEGYPLIPCGIDQNPYFLLQRDIAKQLKGHKNATILSKFLPALTGPNGKMSASMPENAILLSDSESQIKNKINKYAFSGGRETLEEHRLHGGDTSVDVSYLWLYYLFEEDDSKIEDIKNKYESGEMLSGEIKKILIERVQEFVEKHNLRREKAIKDNLLDKYMYSGKLAKNMWKSFY